MVISALAATLFIITSPISIKSIMSEKHKACKEDTRDEYSWYQSMKLSLNFEGKEYTAESTIRVVWDRFKRPRIDPALSTYQPKFYGSMPIVALDGGDFIVLTSLSRFNRHAATRMILPDQNFSEGFSPSYACEVVRGEMTSKTITNGTEQSPGAFFLQSDGNGYDVSYFDGNYLLTVSTSQIGDITDQLPLKLEKWLSKLPHVEATTMPTFFRYPDGLGDALYRYDVWRTDE